MSWLLDTELPLYDWSNSSYTTSPPEVFVTLTPRVNYMNSAAASATPTPMTSAEGGILPRVTCHGKVVSAEQQWTTVPTNVFTRPNFEKSILMQSGQKNIEQDSEISSQICDSHGGDGEEGRRGGGGKKGKGGAAGSSSDSDRLVRRREQNRRAAVNCRRKKKERATNSLMDYQKFQCSNTELRNDVRQLKETRTRLLQQLTSLCQRCASLTAPLPTTDTHVCEDS